MALIPVALTDMGWSRVVGVVDVARLHQGVPDWFRAFKGRVPYRGL